MAVVQQGMRGPTEPAGSGWLTLSKRRATRPARFLLVGLSGVAVSTAVLWVAREAIGFPTTWAGILAWATSTLTNFLLNDAYTWRDRRTGGLRGRLTRLFRYYGTTLVGLVVSLGVLVLLADRLGIYVLLANLVAIGAGGTVNYLVHNVWTWGRGRR